MLAAARFLWAIAVAGRAAQPDPGGLAERLRCAYLDLMRVPIGIAGISLLLALGGCAHRTAGAPPSNGGNAPSADGDVPSKKRGVVLPSDPKLNMSGTQPTSSTGTGGGRIDDSIGKGVGGGSSP